MVEPRAGLVHVVSELRAPLPGAVVEVRAGDRTHRFEGDVSADAVTYVGTVDLAGATDVSVSIKHAATGRVENTYPPLLLAACRP
jgi:hypothetical protein